MLGAQLILLPALFALLVTLLGTPFFVWAYRRRVGELMKGGGEAEEEGDDAASDAAAGASAVVLRSVGGAVRLPAPDATSGLAASLRASRRRAAWAYGVAGACHAAVLTFVFWVHHQDYAPGIALVAAFLLFSLPVVPTVLHVLSASRARRLGAAGLAALMVFAALGIGRELAWSMFKLHLLVPAVLFLVINLRFWRGVAPLVLLLGMIAGFGWTLGFAVWKLVGGGTALLWGLRLGGFAVGAWAALRALRWLGREQASGRLGDEEVFLDSWWLLHTVTQTVIFLVTSGSFLFLATLLAFVVYFRLRRRLLGSSAGPQEGRAPRMLLLRVFGGGARTEALFDRLALGWRWLGPIDMIAGRDLAIRQIAPLDFAAFLTRSLGDRFIGTHEDLDRRLAASDEGAGPDGRWPVRALFCRTDTWQAAMRRLAAGADLVVMDLRDFAMDNKGCRYELRQLARAHPDLPVLLLADDSTHRDALESLVAGGAGSDGGREWWITDPAALGSGPTEQLLGLVAGRPQAQVEPAAAH